MLKGENTMDEHFIASMKNGPVPAVKLENSIGPSAIMTKEAYDGNQDRIYQIRKSQQVCASCDGRICKQTISGFIPVFKSHHGECSYDYYPCKDPKQIKGKLQVEFEQL
jgi:hypothetical protein